MAITGKDIMDRVSSIQGTKSKDVVYQRNQATISGAFVGMIIGIYVGYTKKKNMLVAGALGAIGGAVVIRLFTPKD